MIKHMTEVLQLLLMEENKTAGSSLIKPALLAESWSY